MIISKAYFFLQSKEDRLKAQIQVQTVFLSPLFAYTNLNHFQIEYIIYLT
jgi:hypothetical protein